MRTSSTTNESHAELRSGSAVAIHGDVKLREQVRILAEDVKELASLSKATHLPAL